jgi:hypothetical protein
MTSPAANTPDPTTGLTARSQWILAGASSLLTPEQLQAMRQSLLLDQQRQQFYQEQNKASGKGP